MFYTKNNFNTKVFFTENIIDIKLLSVKDVSAILYHQMIIAKHVTYRTETRL